MRVASHLSRETFDPALLPSTAVATGPDWRVLRDTKQLRYRLEMFAGNHRGRERWEPAFSSTFRDDLLHHISRRRLFVDEACRDGLKRLPQWIGGRSR